MDQVAATTGALQQTSAAITEASTAQSSASPETSISSTTTSTAAPISTSEAVTSKSGFVTQSTSTSSAQSTTASSSAAASSSTSTSSSVAPSTSVIVVTPSSTSTSTSTTAASSSSAGTSTKVVTLTTSAQSAPGYVTTTSRVSASSSAASSAASHGSSSSFPVGGIVGIVVGAVAVLAAIGFFVTRSMRKRARAKRTAARSSMFEPWTTAPAIEDESYEKPTYDNPEPSYPMTHAGIGAGGAGIGAYGAFGHESTPYDAARAPYQLDDYNQQYAADPTYGQDQYGAAAVAAVAPAAVHGLHDGMMVRVKVGFVRSLEDELAVVPGQQLFLHNAYDDGWSLCEDQAQSRGVVPISCLEPWEETAEQPSNDNVIPADDTADRRSSLHANQQ